MSTDEEQIEALKLWWAENGTTLIISIALVLVVLFGYRQWQSSSVDHAGEASDIYQQIADIVANAPASAISDEDAAAVSAMNDQLRADYDDTAYSRYAALFMAKIHVDAGDLDKAEAELSWILDNPGLGLFGEIEEPLLLTARSRLARVVLAKGEAERALSLITAIEPADYAASFAEVEGDILMAMERKDEARQAYERAREAGNVSALLQLKLDDLGA